MAWPAGPVISARHLLERSRYIMEMNSPDRRCVAILGASEPLGDSEDVQLFTNFANYLRWRDTLGASAIYFESPKNRSQLLAKLSKNIEALFQGLLYEIRGGMAKFSPELDWSHRATSIAFGHITMKLARLLAYRFWLLTSIEHTFTVSSFHSLTGALYVPKSSADSTKLLKSLEFETYLDHCLLGQGSFEWFVMGDAKIKPSFVPRPYDQYRRLTALLGNNKHVIRDTNLGTWREIKLDLRVGNLPHLRFLERLPSLSQVREHPLRDYLRERSEDQRDPALRAGCEALSNLLPRVWLEGQKGLREQSHLYYPGHPDSFLTATGYTDDCFNYSVIRESKYSSYSVLQHGNLNGTHLHYDRPVEERTSDRYYTWGWTSSYGEVEPFGIQKDLAVWRKVKPRAREYLLILRGERRNWWPWDVSLEQYDYLDGIAEFVNNLRPLLRANLVVRDYYSDTSPSLMGAEYLQNLVENQLRIVSRNEKLKSRLAKARMVIHGYDSTGILECAAAGRPFIALLPTGTEFLKSQYFPLYTQLLEAKVFFVDMQEAASHLSDIQGREGDWWASESTQSAVKQLSEGLAMVADHDVVNRRLSEVIRRSRRK